MKGSAQNSDEVLEQEIIQNNWSLFHRIINITTSLLKGLDAGRIRPFNRAAADLSPQSLLCIWLQPRLTVEAAHWLINYVLSLRDYFYMFEFESSSTTILRVTPRLTTHSFVTTHHCNEELQL